MPYEIIHSASPVGAALVGAVGRVTQRTAQEEREKRLRKERERAANAALIGQGIGSVADAFGDVFKQKMHDNARLQQIQVAAEMQQKNQLAVIEKEHELDLQAKGYILDFTDQQKQEMTALDQDEYGLEQANAEGTVRPWEYMRLKTEIGNKKASIKKTPKYVGPPQPTAQQQWESGKAGFFDEQRGAYLLVNPKTGGFEVAAPPKNDALEHQQKIEYEVVKGNQEIAHAQTKADLDAAANAQKLQVRQAEHEYDLEEKYLSMAFDYLEEETRNEEGKVIGVKKAPIEKAIKYAKYLRAKFRGEDVASPEGDTPIGGIANRSMERMGFMPQGAPRIPQRPFGPSVPRPSYGPTMQAGPTIPQPAPQPAPIDIEQLKRQYPDPSTMPEEIKAQIRAAYGR